MSSFDLIRLFRIDGAVLVEELSDFEIGGGEAWKLQKGKINKEYKYGALMDDWLWVSKDGRRYVMALAVEVRDTIYKLEDIKEEKWHGRTDYEDARRGDGFTAGSNNDARHSG